MRLIVDGYNIIKQTPDLYERERASLEAARDALVAQLAEIHASSNLYTRITVVFDGQGGSGPSLQRGMGRVRVVFSRKGETADAMIIRLVRGDRQPRGIVVMTDDREVQRHVRASGAQTLSAADLLNEVPALRRPRLRQEPPDKPDPAGESARRINEELKQLWGIEE